MPNIIIPLLDICNILCLLILGILLCTIGFSGFLSEKNNMILFLISNEIFLLGLILGFVSVGELYQDPVGQLFALVILVVAAIETAVILVLFLVFYREMSSWNFDLNAIISQKGFSADE